jgi:hypothetical protein
MWISRRKGTDQPIYVGPPQVDIVRGQCEVDVVLENEEVEETNKGGVKWIMRSHEGKAGRQCAMC